MMPIQKHILKCKNKHNGNMLKKKKRNVLQNAKTNTLAANTLKNSESKGNTDSPGL